MARYRLIAEYIGSHFHGSARAVPLRTVQGVLEESLRRFAKREIVITSSSRTDAGVHAFNNTYHFDLERRHRKTGEIVSCRCHAVNEIYLTGILAETI